MSYVEEVTLDQDYYDNLPDLIRDNMKDLLSDLNNHKWDIQESTSDLENIIYDLNYMENLVMYLRQSSPKFYQVRVPCRHSVRSYLTLSSSDDDDWLEPSSRVYSNLLFKDLTPSTNQVNSSVLVADKRQSVNSVSQDGATGGSICKSVSGSICKSVSEVITQDKSIMEPLVAPYVSQDNIIVSEYMNTSNNMEPTLAPCNHELHLPTRDHKDQPNSDWIKKKITMRCKHRNLYCWVKSN